MATEMVLLGAGASVEAQIPNATNMTREMLDAFARNRRLDRHTEILRFVAAGLLFQKGMGGEDPFREVYIEAVFNAIQLLAERRNLEIAPFVGLWNPVLSDLEDQPLSRSAASDLARQLQALIDGRIAEATRPLAKLLGQIAEHGGLRISGRLGVEMPHRGRTDLGGQFIDSVLAITGNIPERRRREFFKETLEWMIRSLTDMAYVKESDRARYLRPLIQSLARGGGAIATLNFDNAVEAVATDERIELALGIERWSENGVLEFESGKLPLLKLHGSIDWRTENLNAEPPRFPLKRRRTVRVAAPLGERTGHDPAVIFGGRNKLTAEGPFLALFQEFKDRLETAPQLTIIGYSFRDDHINAAIRQWINRQAGSGLRIIDMPEFWSSGVSFINELHTLRRQIEFCGDGASKGIEQWYQT